MNCGSCGLQLPQGAANCPRCGAVTPYYYANTGTTPNDATFVSTPNPVAEQTPPTAYAASPYGAIPPTQYAASPYGATPPGKYAAPPYEPTATAPAGSPAYGAAPQNPYNASPYAPYSALPLTPTPPSLPPVQRSGIRIGIVVGIVVFVLILSGGGVFAFLQYSAARNAAAAAAQATATAHAQATATASAIIALQNPYTHSGTLALSDPLSDNSKGYGWSEDAPNCVFTGGAYHVIAPDARYSDYCLAGATNFNDFAFEAQMQIIKGDAGGLDFRFTSTTNNEYYEFYTGQDGSYDLYLVTGTSSSSIKALTSGSNPAIKQGLKQTNLIAVVAQGHSIMLYVNHQLIDKVTDSTYTGGRIGFDADTLATNGHPTEVVFSNVKVWTL